MIRFLPLLLCALLLALLPACQNAMSYEMDGQRNARVNAAMSPQTPRSSNAAATGNAGNTRQVPAEGEAAEAANAQAGDEGPAYQPQIVYTAELGLQADRVDIAQQKAEQVVADHGGYISASRTGVMTARVPAPRFDAALSALSKLGSVTNKQVQAIEVTDQIVDLESRLANAQTIRDRLIGLVDRANDMQKALEIERELARVTEQIELIEGRLRLAKNQVAYSTIDLTITPTPEEQRLATQVRVQWVRDMGAVFQQQERIDISAPRRLRDGVNIDLPAGFVRYYQEDHVTQAINADGVRVRVRRMRNFEDCEATFWAQLAARSLREIGRMEVSEAQAFEIYNKRVAQVVRAEREMAGETVRYLAGLATSDDYVYVFEAWGVAEGFDRVVEGLEESLSTMRSYESFLN